MQFQFFFFQIICVGNLLLCSRYIWNSIFGIVPTCLTSDGNDHFFHEPRSFTIMSPNVIKIWATIIHFELSKIWSSITHEWSAIIYNHNYFIFSVNFSWFSPINFEIKSENIFAGNFFWSFCKFFQKSQKILKGIWSHLQKVFKKTSI